MRVLLVVLSVTIASAWFGALPATAKDAEFAGINGCTKSCHKKDDDGDQKSLWQKSDHAKAFKTLGTPKAKEAAVKVGFSGNPQEAADCLLCHTTGYGEPASRFDKKFDMKDGVQCEACHGAGENYRKKKTMKAIYDERGPDRKGKSKTAMETGLITPTEKECKICHAPERTFNGKTYKNPSYKDFDFDKKFEKIKHPVPKKS